MRETMDVDFVRRVAEFYPDTKPYRPQAIGVVYFVQEGDKGLVKIGWARNPTRRLTALQIANPRPLRLLGVIAGRRRLEAEIHARYAHLHIRGEWFQPSAELLSYITSAAEQPDA